MTLMKKKRILYIIGSLDIGGSEKQLLKAIDFLKKDFEISVLLLYKKGHLYQTINQNEIKIYDPIFEKSGRIFGIINLIFSLFRCAYLIKRANIDLIHSFLPFSYLVTTLSVLIFKNKKFIMSRRSLNYYQKWKILKKIEYFLHRKTDLIFANSKAIANQLKNEEGVSEEKIKLIYNSVDQVKLLDLKKKKDDRRTLIHIANIIPYKNHKLVLKSLYRIKNRNFKILFIGGIINFDYYKELLELVKSYRLNNQVNFLGIKRNTTSYLVKSTIGLLSSDTEGLPNAVLEYISFGLPVVATDVGGIREIIKDGVNGYLVKKNNSNEMAKRIELLLSSNNLRKKLSKKSSEISIKKFSNKNLEQYKKEYLKLF